MKTFKVIVLGDKKCGKTTFLNRMKTGDFTKNYIQTKNVEIFQINFKCANGETIFFNLYDCPGDNEYNKDLWNGAHGFFIFFDIANEKSSPHYWIHTIQKHYEEKCPSIVICGNKIDLREGQSRIKKIKVIDNIPFFLLSAKSNYNFEKPFISLCRSLTGNEYNI